MSAAVVARSTQPKSKRKPLISKLTCSVLLGMFVGLAGFTAVVGGALLLFAQDADFVVPGVMVNNRDLGGMSMDEAQQTIAAMPLPKIMLVSGEDTWEAPASDLGFAVDARRTARLVMDKGRRDDALSLPYVLWDGVRVAPIVNMSPELARAGLEKWATAINVEPQDAAFRIENGQVITLPPQAGRALDVEATLGLLLADPNLVMSKGFLPLVVTELQPNITDVSAQAAQVQELLTTPLQINAYDPITNEWYAWIPTTEQVASWLGVQDGNVVVAPDKILGFVAEQGNTLGADRFVDVLEAAPQIESAFLARQPATVIVRHHPTTYIVESGDNLTRIGFKVGMPYWYIINANPGLDVNGLYAGQELIIPSKDEMLPLPVVANKRILVSISQQRAWVYEDGQQIREFVISTGIDSSPTQPGIFQVRMHDENAYASVWDLWMPHFLGIYEVVPDFMNGFHGLPTLSSGVQLWANVLGRPASYGCIILTLEDAEWLYNWAEDGTVVEIQG
jgi:lipoprotein-anchoring transpeptidase ErfK/SrfK